MSRFDALTRDSTAKENIQTEATRHFTLHRTTEEVFVFDMNR